MDGVIRKPPLRHTSSIYKRKIEKDKTSEEEKVPAIREKKEMR